MAFERQPLLIGDLLCLRPLRLDNFNALYAVASDPLIWEQHPERHRYRPEVFALFYDEVIASGGALCAAASRDRQLIGSSRFHGYNQATSEVEIGWTFLARSHWGGSSNRELKRLMLDHAFRFVRGVTFVVGEHNRRSRRAVEKIGGKWTGQKTDKSGHVSMVYKLTAAEWTSLTHDAGALGVVGGQR